MNKVVKTSHIKLLKFQKIIIFNITFEVLIAFLQLLNVKIYGFIKEMVR